MTFALIAAAPALAVSADDSMAGNAPATALMLNAELNMRNPGHIHPEIAWLYAILGPQYGIRADIAFAQMLHETDSLRYGGLVQPGQNNMAGIGATGPGHPGNSYPTAEAGVRAHYELLSYYINVRGLRTPRSLGGTWAVPGTGYGDTIARYASEIYNFNAAGHWKGNFNEVTGTREAALSTTFYFPWYDSKPGNAMAGNWILVGNQGSGTARVEIFIGGEKMRDPGNPGNDFFLIPEGGRVTPQWPDRMSGPVKVVSISGQKLIASQRVLYRDTFNEVSGTPEEGLTDSLQFTWYDSQRESGMFGNWILVSNQGSAPADVEILVGGVVKATYSAAGGNALAPGAIVTPQFPELIGGPVIVRSTNGQPLIASQRVLYQDSFNEVMGYPTAALSDRYFFTWYDSDRRNGMRGDWVLVSNQGTVNADVEIRVGGALLASYSAAGGNPLAPGQIVTPQFANLTNGPVEVISTNTQPLIVSQRILFRDSFEEVQGMPPAALADNQLFTWYDSLPANGMFGNWILVANQGSVDANVEIYIGGVRMHDPANPGNDFFTIAPGARITPQFANTMNGPVRVVSTNGQPLMTSQRVLYKFGIAVCSSGCA